MNNVLVTGGLGFIGSHTVVNLISEGYNVIIVDNLSNSEIEVLDKIELISNKRPKFYQIDMVNYDDLKKVFDNEKIDYCIHFAGLKAVGESVSEPLMYYENNLFSTINLLKLMKENSVYNLVFSSSATVYGKPTTIPISEDSPVGDTSNPYGTTKYFIERIIEDFQTANPKFSCCLLRYFNPIGAHKSGLIGENPRGIPNNLMPYITQTAIGIREILNVYGNDYDTPDGTGVRDYIHVLDLAYGHVCALKHLKDTNGLMVYNLGTGKGYSVLEIINTFEKVNNVKIPYRIVERRPGDIDSCYADTKKAKKELGFIAKYSLSDMCKDSWNYQLKKRDNGEL